MSPSPHNVALFVLTAGAAVAALLLADAADEARRQISEVKRRRVSFLSPASWFPAWVRPAAYHLGSLVFLGGMATSGAVLIGAFP